MKFQAPGTQRQMTSLQVQESDPKTKKGLKCYMDVRPGTSTEGKTRTAQPYGQSWLQRLIGVPSPGRRHGISGNLVPLGVHMAGPVSLLSGNIVPFPRQHQSFLLCRSGQPQIKTQPRKYSPKRTQPSSETTSAESR